MNKTYKLIWSNTKHCFVVAPEIARRRGKLSRKKISRSMRNFFVAGVLSVMGGTAVALDLVETTNLNLASTPLIRDAITAVPTVGTSGLDGRGGYYSCNEMTWGLACAKFYGFGNYTERAATNGRDAPSGASGIQFDVTNPIVLDVVVPAPDSGVTAGSYSIVVTKVASGQVWSTDKDAGITATTLLNGGAPFALTVTPPAGSAITLSLGANTTLEGLRSAIAGSASLAGYTANVETVFELSGQTYVDSGKRTLSLSGPTGAGNDYTISTAVFSSTWTPTLTGGFIANGKSFELTLESGQVLAFPINTAPSAVVTAINAISGYSASVSGSDIVIKSHSTFTPSAKYFNDVTDTVGTSFLSGAAATSTAVSQLAFDRGTATVDAQKFDANGQPVYSNGTPVLESVPRVGYVSQDAEYKIGSGATLTSTTNAVTVAGVPIILSAIGTSDLTVQTIVGAVSNGGTTDATTALAGTAGSAISSTINATSVRLTGSAVGFVGETVGGQGGNAQVGGQGGAGGKGGNAVTDTIPRIMVIVFPPLTIPDTDTLTIQGAVGGTGAQGGTGGSGSVGGVGGAINVSLSADTAAAGTLSRMSSVGGQGGTGGVGGLGGTGGAGGDAAAAVESENLLPVIRSAPGNTGGVGGLGGLGGQGGRGGSGGVVTLTTNFLQSSSTFGHEASSIGGQGGTGGQGGSGGQGGAGGQGVAFTDFVLDTTQQNGRTGGQGGNGFTGGAGGIGGDGGNVTLTNTVGSLVVSDVGLFAVSQGGVGGTGGQGGQGGQGGTGGNGDAISNYTPLNLQETSSKGGLGGDGANGGVGGAGGLGGSGGSVTVTNNGANGTIVAGVNAIHAVSRGGIGGAGGLGGTGGTGGTGGLAGYEAPIANAAYSGINGAPGAGGKGGNGNAGGAGAAGGNAGSVVVVNQQQLRTTGTQFSSALLAESLGAIGGVGGEAGAAGLAGAGGAAGRLESQASDGPGDIFCKALTGSGTVASVISGNTCTVVRSWNAGTDGLAGNASSSLGATSYVGGKGGTVTITNSNEIKTVGSNSDAIMAISMGGVHGLDSYNPNQVFRNGLFVDNQSGGADTVSVTNTDGEITTTGSQSSAVMALSVGAGHAAGAITAINTGSLTTTGDDAPALVAASRVYQNARGTAGTAGTLNAGAVAVANTNGEIRTSGASSSGVHAESLSKVGAAGNVAVSNGDSLTDTPNGGSIILRGTGNTSAILALSRAEGAGSDSGAVTINNRAGYILSETGGSAYAIDARSVSLTGNSRTVTFDNTGGYIETDSSSGAVYLFSSANAGAGSTDNKVSAKNASSIISTGYGSTAITLESVGGNLEIENGGLIQGGATGSAISFIGGATNTIRNDETIDVTDRARIITTGTVQDVVIRATTGNDTINNVNGAYIRGSINLGSGTNAINNESGSLIDSGSEINLGTGLFSNNGGHLSPGGLNNVLSNSRVGDRQANALNLTGSFSQNATGRLVMDVNFATGIANKDYGDFIQVIGTASLDGFVELNPSSGAAKPGRFSLPLMTSTGTMSHAGDNSIELYPFFANGGGASTTVVFKPSLSVYVNSGATNLNAEAINLSTASPAGLSYTDNTLYLNYVVNYSPDSLTQNQGSVADVINTIQTDGVPSYQPIADELLKITDEAEYSRALDSLSGEGVIATQQAALSARSSFVDAALSSSTTLLECDSEVAKTNPEACDKGSRTWAVLQNRKTDQTGDNGVAGSENTNNAFFGGIESRVSANTVLGFSGGYTRSSYSVPTRWTSGTSDHLNAAFYHTSMADSGLGVKTYVSAGFSQNTYQRTAMGNPVKGNSDSASYGLGLEVFYRYVNGPVLVTPFIGVQQEWLHQSKHSEDDVLWGNEYKTQVIRSRPATAGLSFAGRFNRASATIMPKIRYVYSKQTDSRQRTITAASLAAPGYYWTVSGPDAARSDQAVDLSLRLQIGKYTFIELQGYRNWSDKSSSDGGGLKFERLF